MLKYKYVRGRKRGVMGRVSNWLHDHSFHHENLVGFRATQKTMWETVLLVILVATVVFAVIELMSPYMAF